MTEMFRQRKPEIISIGDGINVDGHGPCMVVAITDVDSGSFSALSEAGVLLPLILVLKTTHETTHTLQ